MGEKSQGQMSSSGPEVTLGSKMYVKAVNELQGWDVVVRKKFGH